MADGTTDTTTTTTTTTDPNASKPWYEGADQETIGHIQSKGWHEKTPAEAALAAVAAHRQAEKHIGVPADKLARIPDATDSEGWKAFYQRLGAPKDPAEYDFSAVKRGDQPLSEAEVAFYRSQAAALNLTKEAAVSYAKNIVDNQTSAATAAQADQDAALAASQAKLKENWGANFEANKFVASQAAAKLGVTPEVVAQLEKTTSYDQTMEMFRKIGALIGEDKFITNHNPNLNNGVMTKEQAVARIAELKADTEWGKRYLAGGTAERREMDALIQLQVG